MLLACLLALPCVSQPTVCLRQSLGTDSSLPGMLFSLIFAKLPHSCHSHLSCNVTSPERDLSRPSNLKKKFPEASPRMLGISPSVLHPFFPSCAFLHLLSIFLCLHIHFVGVGPCLSFLKLRFNRRYIRFGCTTWFTTCMYCEMILTVSLGNIHLIRSDKFFLVMRTLRSVYLAAFDYATQYY